MWVSSTVRALPRKIFRNLSKALLELHSEILCETYEQWAQITSACNPDNILDLHRPCTYRLFQHLSKAVFHNDHHPRYHSRLTLFTQIHLQTSIWCNELVWVLLRSDAWKCYASLWCIHELCSSIPPIIKCPLKTLWKLVLTLLTCAL